MTIRFPSTRAPQRRATQRLSGALPCNWLLGLGLLTLCSASLPSRADEEDPGSGDGPGSWVLSKIEGQYTFTNPEGEFSTATSNLADINGVSTYRHYQGEVLPGSLGTFTMTGKSSYKVTLHWQGNGTPTPRCTVLFTPSALISVGGYNDTAQSWTLRADNGVGSPKTQSSGTIPPYFNPNVDGDGDGEFEGEYTHLGEGGVQADQLESGLQIIDTSNPQVVNGVSEVKCDVKFKPEARSTITMHLPEFNEESGANFYVNVGMSAKVDDRGLWLSRGGRHEYSTNEDGEWHTYGDSIYSVRNTATMPIPPGFLTHLSFHANLAGEWPGSLQQGGYELDVDTNWATSLVTNVDGAILMDMQNTSKFDWEGSSPYGTPTVLFENPFFNKDLHGPTTGPQRHDVTCSVVASDGTNAKSYYHLTLHDPVENVSAPSLSIYKIFTPMSDGTQDLAWHGPRSANTPEARVRTFTSTELGTELTGTIDINLLGQLLGFSAQSTTTSTVKVEVDTEAKVPEIPEDCFRYLIARHTFQRKHVRFYRYDEQGKVKRFYGNPSQEVYHEAMRDKAFVADFIWSGSFDSTDHDADSLPRTVEPEPEGYKYPDAPSAGAA